MRRIIISLLGLLLVGAWADEHKATGLVFPAKIGDYEGGETRGGDSCSYFHSKRKQPQVVVLVTIRSGTTVSGVIKESVAHNKEMARGFGVSYSHEKFGPVGKGRFMRNRFQKKGDPNVYVSDYRVYPCRGGTISFNGADLVSNEKQLNAEVDQIVAAILK